MKFTPHFCICNIVLAKSIFYTDIAVYSMVVYMSTIKVPKSTLRKLEKFKVKMDVKTFEEVILRLIDERRRELVEKFLVSIKGEFLGFLRRIGLILIFDSYAWI